VVHLVTLVQNLADLHLQSLLIVVPVYLVRVPSDFNNVFIVNFLGIIYLEYFFVIYLEFSILICDFYLIDSMEF
jgi:hypothetical protein